MSSHWSTPTTKDSCSPSAPRIHIDKNKCYRIYYVYIQYTILKGIEHNKWVWTLTCFRNLFTVCSIGLGTSIINFYIFKIIDKCSIYGLFWRCIYVHIILHTLIAIFSRNFYFFKRRLFFRIMNSLYILAQLQYRSDS